MPTLPQQPDVPELGVELVSPSSISLLQILHKQLLSVESLLVKQPYHVQKIVLYTLISCGSL